MKLTPQSRAELLQAIRIHLAGRFLEARSLYEAFLAGSPPNSVVLHLMGVTYLQADEPAKGLPWIEQALALDPDHPEALGNRGAALRALRRYDEALASFDRSLALKPDQFDALYHLGQTLQEMRRYEDAVPAYRRALVLKPNHAAILSNLGVALRELCLLEEAKAAFGQALAAQPDFPEAHNNLASLFQEQNRLDEALAHLQRAIALKPDYAVAYNNLATVFIESNRHGEALEACATALALRPGYDEAAWNLGLAHLFHGDFRKGWPLYEKRWSRQRADPPPPEVCPLWSGEESLEGKRLLVQAEQGLGDLLQAARYLPLLAARGAHCHVQAPETLRALLGRSFPQARIVGVDERFRCDYRIPLMSLPLALKTDGEEAIPRAVPYLAADPARMEHWSRRLNGGFRRRIGLVWRGNQRNVKGLHRSARLDDFLPFLAQALARQDVQCVALQKDLAEEEASLLKSQPHVVALDAELLSLDDTAAVMAALDHVVTIDSATAHLAGALGKPLSLLLPFGADWRWMIGRGDSPWYPTARLFRQVRAGDWSGPVRAAAAWEDELCS